MVTTTLLYLPTAPANLDDELSTRLINQPNSLQWLFASNPAFLTTYGAPVLVDGSVSPSSKVQYSLAAVRVRRGLLGGEWVGGWVSPSTKVQSSLAAVRAHETEKCLLGGGGGILAVGSWRGSRGAR